MLFHSHMKLPCYRPFIWILVSFVCVVTYLGALKLRVQTASTTCPPNRQPDLATARNLHVSDCFENHRYNIVVDAAHRNYHTLDCTYAAFGVISQRAGYNITSVRLTGSMMPPLNTIIVIAGALAFDSWSHPFSHQAFQDSEIQRLHRWVTQGGSLLLAFDHMPLSSATKSLALAFGVSFSDDFTFQNVSGDLRGTFDFVDKPLNGQSSIGTHVITTGQQDYQRISRVTTFTGQAFDAKDGAPLLILGDDIISAFPTKPWIFDDAPLRRASGKLQGVAIEVGKGRVIVLGECAFITAQRVNGQPSMGLNVAPHNVQFLLNTLRWLSHDFEVF